MCRGKRSQQHSKKFITLKNNQPNKRGNSIFHVENEYLVLFIPENVITICLNWLPKHKPLRIFYSRDLLAALSACSIPSCSTRK